MSKKVTVFIAFAVIIIVVSCSNNETIGSNPKYPTQQTSNIRSYEEALQIAQASIEMVDGKAATRAVAPRKINLSDCKVLRYETNTRSLSNASDTLMYAFNFEDNQGFAIVSASKNTEALIAVTEKGHFDPDIPSEIEGFNMFIEMAKRYIQGAPKSDPLLPVLLYKDSIVYNHYVMGPFVTVKWGQYFPEGEYCSNGVAGCTNTAMAQIMSYFNYPTSIDLTYAGADISTQQLNWNQMKVHETGHDVSQCLNESVHRSIGRLHRQLGKLNQSDYNSGVTNTNDSFISGTFTYLGYQTDSLWYDLSDIVSSVNSNCLVLMTGLGYYQNHYRGHHWVYDGYDLTEEICYHLERVSANSNEWIISSVEITPTYLCHYNWGWYGECNGYFSFNVFDTQNGVYYDQLGNTIQINFDLAVKGIKVRRNI